MLACCSLWLKCWLWNPFTWHETCTRKTASLAGDNVQQSLLGSFANCNWEKNKITQNLFKMKTLMPGQIVLLLFAIQFFCIVFHFSYTASLLIWHSGERCYALEPSVGGSRQQMSIVIGFLFLSMNRNTQDKNTSWLHACVAFST